MDNTLLSNTPMPGMQTPIMQTPKVIFPPRQIVRVVVGLIIIVAAIYLAIVAPKSLAASSPDAKSYQAIFLDNNQVYFGKLANASGQWFRLTDVYYLQENQPPRTPPKGETPPRFTLLKLGRQELHGPTDMMVFNREHVLFWENLKSDSEVVKKIGEDKEQQAKEQTKK